MSNMAKKTIAKTSKKTGVKKTASKIATARTKTVGKAAAKVAKKVPAKPAKPVAKTGAKKTTPPVVKKVAKTGVKRTTLKTDAQAKRSHDFVIAAARLMAELHCENVLVLDVREKSQITDYILIASGTSEVQIRAVAQQVLTLGKQSGLTVFGRSLEGAAAWVALDLVEAVVHIFSPEQRAHYDLEMMWGDAPRLRWQRPAGKKAGV